MNVRIPECRQITIRLILFLADGCAEASEHNIEVLESRRVHVTVAERVKIQLSRTEYAKIKSFHLQPCIDLFDLFSLLFQLLLVNGA